MKAMWMHLLFYLPHLASAQLEAVIIPPLVYNAFMHSQKPGTFTCVTRNSDDVRWVIDGIAHTQTFITQERNITVHVTSTTLHYSQVSLIMIPAIPINRHITNIKCRAYKIFGQFERVESTETAQFNIQGLLGMPPNISYTNYNVSHNLVEWLEPETLNITGVEPDIENYTICLNITDECINTTADYIIIQKYFVAITVSVTAWNIVGESNSSAQLVIVACTESSAISSQETDQEFHVEVVFDSMNRNLTLLHITNNQSKESSSSSCEYCPYLYTVIVVEKTSHSTITTCQVYGYYHSIVLTLSIPRNQLYTAHMNRTTSTAVLPLNPIDFNTNEIQDVNATLIASGTLYIAFHLRAGSRVQHLIVQLMGNFNRPLLWDRSFNISEECFESIVIQPCLVSTIFNLPSAMFTGNQSLNITVLGREAESIVNNELYFDEFVYFTFVNENETPNRTKDLMNTTSPTPTIFNNFTNITRGNSSNSSTLVWIISVQCCKTAAGGGLLGVILLICGLILVVKKGHCLITRKRKLSIATTWNVPNPMSLELSLNEAYDKCARPTSEPHLYEELPQLLQEDKTGTLTVPNRFYRED